MNRLVRPFLLPLVLSLPAVAQPPQPGSSGVATEVVVTAEAVPQEACSLGVAATVVDRAAIERSRAATVADLLRSVPGVDVAQSGGPGRRHLALPARRELELGPRPRRRRQAEQPLLRRRRPLLARHRERRADRDRARAVLGALRLGGPRRRRPGRHPPRGRRRPLGERAPRPRERLGPRGGRERRLPRGRDRRHAPASGAGRWRATCRTSSSRGRTSPPRSTSSSRPAVKTGVTVRRESSRTGIPFSGVDRDAAGARRPPTRRSSPSRSRSSLGARTTLEAAGTFADDSPDLQRPRRPVGLHLLRDAGAPRRRPGRPLARRRREPALRRHGLRADEGRQRGLVRRPARRPDDAHLVRLRRGPALARGRPPRRHRGRPPRRARRLRRLHEPARRPLVERLPRRSRSAPPRARPSAPRRRASSTTPSRGTPA